MKKLICLLLTLLMSVGCLCACRDDKDSIPSKKDDIPSNTMEPEEDENSFDILVGGGHYEEDIPFEPMTEEEIILAIKEKYYDENGEPIVWYWDKTTVWAPDYMREKILQDTGKDGFEFSKIKNMLTGKEEFFLVEFKPYGHLIGYLRQNKNKEHLNAYFWGEPSPYKILDIPYENRYLHDISAEGIALAYTCTLKDGEFVTISDEAYAAFYKDQKFTRYGKYDFTTHKWITYKLNEKTKKWERYDKETNSWIPIE